MDYQEVLNKQVEENKAIVLTIESSLYSKKTLFRTSYKFTDKAFIFIRHDNNKNNYIICLTAKDKVNTINLAQEFTNELLDQELRDLVLQDTKKIRDVIVTRALLSGYSNAV